MKCLECGRNMTSMMKVCPSCGWEVSSAPAKKEEEPEVVVPSAFKGAYVPAQTMADLKSTTKSVEDDVVDTVEDEVVEDVVDEIEEEVTSAASPFKPLGEATIGRPSLKSSGLKNSAFVASTSDESAAVTPEPVSKLTQKSSGLKAKFEDETTPASPFKSEPVNKISERGSGLSAKIDEDASSPFKPEPVDKLSEKPSGIKNITFTGSAPEKKPANSAFVPLKDKDESKAEEKKQPSGIKGVTFTPMPGAKKAEAPEEKSGLNSAFVPKKAEPEKKASSANSAFAPKKEEPEKKTTNSAFVPKKSEPEKKPLGLGKKTEKAEKDVKDMVETSSSEVTATMNVLQMKPDAKYVYYGDVPVTNNIETQIEAAIIKNQPKEEVDNLPSIVAMVVGIVIIVIGIIINGKSASGVTADAAAITKAIYSAVGMATIGLGLMTAAMGFLKFKR